MVPSKLPSQILYVLLLIQIPLFALFGFCYTLVRKYHRLMVLAVASYVILNCNPSATRTLLARVCKWAMNEWVYKSAGGKDIQLAGTVYIKHPFLPSSDEDEICGLKSPFVIREVEV